MARPSSTFWAATVEDPVDPDDPSQGERTKTVIEDGATVFTLGVFVMGMIYDKSSSLSRGDDDGEIGITTRINESDTEAVRYGLRGWRNVPDQNRHDIPFKTVKRHTNGRTYHLVVDECLERPGHPRARPEIKRRSEVSRAEEKDSATA